jgi:hypothetical protein
VVIVPYKGASAVLTDREINSGLVSAPMQARFKQLAAEARPGTPEDLATFVAASFRNGRRWPSSRA